MKVFQAIAFLFLVTQICNAQIDNLDPGFGNGGVAAAHYFEGWDESQAAIRYPDGKILVVGRTRNTQNKYVISVARFLANGQPDNSFGTQGKATYNPNAEDNIIEVVDPVLQPDGKIIIPGTININNVSKRILVRVLANGTIDNSFATNGFYLSSFPNEEEICQCGLFPDGRIWCLGANQVPAPPNSLQRSRFSSIRLLANGAIDTSYNGTNFKLHPFESGEGYDAPISAHILSDSSAIFAGFNQPSLNGTRRMLLIKVNFKGNFDSTFGTNGIIRHLPPYSQFLPTRIKSSANGGFIMTGQARLSGTGQIGNAAVYRFRNNGRLDSTFGLNGIAVTPFVRVNANNFLAVDLEEDAQRKIWVGHYGQNSSGIRTFAVSRFLPNGAIDTSYGRTGYIMTGLAGDPNRIFLEPDGFPILTGTGLNGAVTEQDDMVAIKVKPNALSVLAKKTSQLTIKPTLAERGTPIRIYSETNEPAAWQLINSAGQVLIGERVEIKGEEYGVVLQTSHLSPGVYQIRQLSQKGIRQARLMVY